MPNGVTMQEKITSEADINFESVVVDRDAGIIRGVVICGNESKNGYEYPPNCFGTSERAKALYEGKPICIDHKMDPKNPNMPAPRDVRDVAGWITNVRMENGRPVGDIEVEKNINCGVDLMGLAEKRRPGIGLSHVAICKMSSNKKTALAVEHVVTVDVVVSPATTKTFFEQEKQEQNQMELEQLKSALDTLKSENAVLKSDLAKSVQAIEGHKTEANALVTEVTSLRAELADIKPKLEAYQSTEKLTADKLAVEKLVTESGLDIKDSVVVSEQFMSVLLAASAEARPALIADRKAAVEFKAAPGSVQIRSLERQVKTEGSFDPASYLKTHLKGVK